MTHPGKSFRTITCFNHEMMGFLLSKYFKQRVFSALATYHAELRVKPANGLKTEPTELHVPYIDTRMKKMKEDITVYHY